MFLRRLLGFIVFLIAGCYLELDLFMSEQKGIPDWTPTDNPTVEVIIHIACFILGLCLLLWPSSSGKAGATRR